ncbi:calcium/calmodulin-dependent protein kinase kinase [Verticillium alfalfae VaMs.102]|uniref:Calcium/calmodulin-dependent protein kinase kinase n=1 Tax=Verticillium alfalfae (strain VaMs.102 / ATCC MYA-4576 / FGSC 10136) TaxID=526221 RepID=C9SPR4_VERA1|nr:calcium/calmodulin-dependent protein kinase kinase [Verticillium alfalfae VaMs.102]EEY20779.1 calcium/calmodulin-dependent protein kinase kinase [Verticillium alfalfae VaMs.102]
MADPEIPAASLSSPEIAIHSGDGSDSEPRPPLTPHMYVQPSRESNALVWSHPHPPRAARTSPSEPTAHTKSYHSPMRHHRRTPSAHREVKETLDARTEYPGEGDEGQSHHRINQYIIKEEIGRGSYGAVHLAVDQFGTEYVSHPPTITFNLGRAYLPQAVKEFSKASEECCRCWFRDLILGIEYPPVHAQGVIHRDIKPDNLLLTEDEVLKVVDFGVSEMFEKPDRMMTAKSAGSPAFLAPELCVARHGDVSGKAADIWSMGVSLYCLRYGKLPFSHDGVLEIYEAIKSDPHEVPEDENPHLADLLSKILEKDPQNRIKMADLRQHPWVTKEGADPLLSEDDNCAMLVDPPNELELNRAFTRKMNHLLCVMKAIQKFKVVLARHRANAANRRDDALPAPKESDFDPAEARARAEEIEALVERRRNFIARHNSSRGTGDGSRAASPRPEAVPELLTELEPLFLGIGTGACDEFGEPLTADTVAESPTNADFNVYDRAYEEEVQRIMANPARKPTMYLTRFVKERENYRTVANVVDGTGGHGPGPDEGKGRFADLVTRLGQAVRSKEESREPAGADSEKGEVADKLEQASGMPHEAIAEGQGQVVAAGEKEALTAS